MPRGASGAPAPRTRLTRTQELLEARTLPLPHDVFDESERAIFRNVGLWERSVVSARGDQWLPGPRWLWPADYDLVLHGFAVPPSCRQTPTEARLLFTLFSTPLSKVPTVDRDARWLVDVLSAYAPGQVTTVELELSEYLEVSPDRLELDERWRNGATNLFAMADGLAVKRGAQLLRQADADEEPFWRRQIGHTLLLSGVQAWRHRRCRARDPQRFTRPRLVRRR